MTVQIIKYVSKTSSATTIVPILTPVIVFFSNFASKINYKAMQRFFDLPLWLSIPLALFYVAMWVAFLRILFWRGQRNKDRIK